MTNYILLSVYIAEEEIAGCLSFIVRLLCFGHLCSVSLPHNASVWSVVCGRGISYSYSYY